MLKYKNQACIMIEVFLEIPYKKLYKTIIQIGDIFMLKLAIIGAGSIGGVHADSCIELKDKCEVIMICNAHIKKAEDMIKEKGFNATATEDYDEVLNNKDVDAVLICVPPLLHCEYAIRALEAKKHVLLEKPMASSLEECDKIINAAKKNDRILSVVSQNRFMTPMYKIKKMLDSNAIGRPLHTTVNSLWWRGASYYDLWWRGTWEKESGGTFTINAVHHLDITLWMLGLPKAVTAVITNTNHTNSECEDLGMAILEYDGMLAQVTASIVDHGEEQQMVFQGEKAKISIPWSVAANKSQENGFPEPDPETEKEVQKIYDGIEGLTLEGHTGQINNFINAILGEEEIVVSGQDARNVMQVVHAIYKSSTTRTTVTLPIADDDPFYKHDTMVEKMPKFFEKTKSVDGFSSSKITLARDVGK